MWSYGIDVSNWQGVIDWDVLNQSVNVQFAYLCLSDGYWRGRTAGAPLSIAESYNMNLKRCRKPCGPYTFARPHNTDPTLSATQSIRDSGVHVMPHCLDLEDYDVKAFRDMSMEEVVDWAGQWLTTIERMDGRRPIIYTGAFFKGPGIMRYFPDHFWWLPSYTSNSKINPDPLTARLPNLNGNRPPDMWQYTDHGRVPGISGNVDRNLILTEKLLTLIHFEGEDMPTLDEIAALVKSATGSAIYHVDPHKSERFKYLASIGAIGEITPDTVPDLAFQVFPDFTMVQRTGEEVTTLKYIGVPDNGFRDDAWFGLLRVNSRDVA